MADMEKERTEESMDDGAFSMYSDWIENGEAGYEQEQEMSQPPAREEVQAEPEADTRQEMPQPSASKSAAGTETVGSLSAKCEKLRQQISSEKDRMKQGISDMVAGEAPDSIQENINRLENELAEAERHLQVLNDAQEADYLASLEQRAHPRNPLEALIKIVEKNAPEEAAALKEVQQYMEEMDSNYKSMRRELIDLRIQLADHIDGSGMGSSLKNLEKNAEELKAHNDGFKKNIFQKAADVIEKFKAKGTTALNNVVQKLGIKEALQNDQKYYQHNAGKMQKAVDRLDAINSEIYAAKNHIKNIGRLAAGKEAGQPQQGRENIIIKILRKPYVHDRDMYQQMADRTGQRIERLEKLEEKAARAKSTLAKLSDYKKKTGSRSGDQQEKQDRENTKKEPQMAL